MGSGIGEKRPVPERRLDYSDIKSRYEDIAALFEEYLDLESKDRRLAMIGDGIDLIKTVEGLPEGRREWFSLFREIYGTSHLYRISHIVQTEAATHGDEFGEAYAALTTYSFMSFPVAGAEGSLTARRIIHSTRWSEDKELGKVAPVFEEGVVLDAHMSLDDVRAASRKAPIGPADKTDLDMMIAAWQDK